MLDEKEQSTDTRRFWEFITRNLRTLIVYGIVGGAAALTLTFFMPKEYKSYGIVYPPSSTSIDNSIDFPNFGYDIEADRLIQIMQSTEIRNAVTEKFDLVNYFEIKKSDADWADQLMKKYHKNIRFERMPSMSVLISARTKDAELSSEIVNFIITSTDLLREKIYKKNIDPAFLNAQHDYESQKLLVDSVQAQLTLTLEREKLSSLLMLTSDAQISVDIDKLSAVRPGSTNADLGARLIAFKSMYDILKEYKTRFIKIKKSYANPIPKLYVINYAEPNFKKVSPSFLVNTAVGVIFSLFIAVIVLLIRNNLEHR